MDFDLGSADEKKTTIGRCPGCGANILFNPETGNLKCAHCGTNVDLPKARSQKLPISQLNAESSNNNTWNDTKVFSCNNCGAKEVLLKSDIAKNCAFCGATSVVDSNELSGLRPNAVVPFKVTKETAIERVIAWAKKKLFAPKKFKKNVTPDDVDGTYTPAFTFDTTTVTRYNATLQRIETYTTRDSRGNIVTHSRTVNFNISGTHNGNFENVLVQASNTISQQNIDKISPFNINDSSEYRDEFIYGIKATQYTKDGQKCWNEAKNTIDANIKKAILSGHSYTSIVSFNADTTYNNVTFRYVLLPVYVGHLNFKQKLYNFFVNGESGKVTGKTPVSTIKVLGAVGIGLLILGGLVVAGLAIAGVFS